MFLARQAKALVERRHVLVTLVRRDLRVRYARSVLGYVWTVLDPLMMALVYMFIFTFIFTPKNRGFTPYFLFLLVGLLGWQWFNASVTETARALLAEARLVRSANLPRELWVVRVVIAKGVEFLLSLPVLVAFSVYYVIKGESSLHWGLLWFPVGIAIQTVLQVGIGLILAPITVLVTDLQRVVRIALRVGFYLTPVIYSVSSAPTHVRTLLALNPMTGVTELYRAGFFEGPVDVPVTLVGAGISLVTLAVGVVVFGRLERAVLKEI